MRRRGRSRRWFSCATLIFLRMAGGWRGACPGLMAMWSASRSGWPGLARTSWGGWSSASAITMRCGHPMVSALALVSEDSGGRERLLVVRPGIAAAETALPVARSVIGPPAWSPDGRWVAFATCTSAARDARPYRITRAIPWLDGLGLVDDAAPDICVVDAQTGQWRQLTADGWVNTAPVWLAGSAEIMYLASCDPGEWDRSYRVRAVSLDGAVRDLATFP